MASAVKKYGYINAKLRACLSKRITHDQFRRMIDANDLTEALQTIKNTDYGSAFEKYHETGDIKMVERELIYADIVRIQSLKKYIDLDISGIIDGILERYETESLKDVLRYWFDRTYRKRDVDDHVVYMLKYKILADIDYSGIVYAGDTEEVLEKLEGTHYYDTVKQYLPLVLNGESLFRLECELENTYFLRLIGRINKLKSRDREIALRIIGIQIDMENITRLSRTVRFLKGIDIDFDASFIPGGRSINITEMQKALDTRDPHSFIQDTVGAYYGTHQLISKQDKDRGDSFFILILSLLQEIFISEVMKLLIGYPFTIGIVLAYCFIKQNEMKKIMRILNAKYYNIDESRMQELI